LTAKGHAVFMTVTTGCIDIVRAGLQRYLSPWWREKRWLPPMRTREDRLVFKDIFVAFGADVEVARRATLDEIVGDHPGRLP
jgi:hypothetical protein